MDVLAEREGRTFVAVTLTNVSEFQAPFPGALYPCLIWGHDVRVTDEARLTLASALLDSGCRYAVCGGADCEAWHDSVDVEFVKRHLDDSEQQLEASFVMTTWHRDEPPDDVAHFFVRNTNFDSHNFKHFVVLHVGNGPERDLVNAAVRKYASNGDAV
jgi:hypothetical protein